MIAQDTGGAIRGPVRGDVFWGHGRDAEEIAGRMKHQGVFFLLLPKGVADKRRATS
jgi:membrane-bound lytic murein transglycosylase A